MSAGRDASAKHEIVPFAGGSASGYSLHMQSETLKFDSLQAMADYIWERGLTVYWDV